MIFDYISHKIDKDGFVVIDAIYNNNSYQAFLRPKIQGGRALINKSDIDTQGLDNPEEFKEALVSYITTNRGQYKEMPLIVEDK